MTRLLALTALLVPLASSEPARAATTLLVGDRGGSMIWRVDAATGAATIFATGIDEPEDLEVDVDGSVLVMRRSAASPTTAQITRIYCSW